MLPLNQHLFEQVSPEGHVDPSAATQALGPQGLPCLP
jgi:hypothetical protein